MHSNQQTQAILNKINKIFVINLDRSPERWANVSNNLNKLNIKYERFKAIDGYDVLLTDIISGHQFSGMDLKNRYAALELNHQYTVICNPENENPTIFTFDYHRPPINKPYFSPGLFGVYCSNLMIAKEIVSNGYNYTIICEDDITIKPEKFLEKLANYIQHLPSTFDLGYVGVYRDNDHVININPYVNQFTQDNGFFTRMALIESYAGASKLLSTAIFRSSLDNFILDSYRASMLEVYVATDDLRLMVSITGQQSDINDMASNDCQSNL